MDKILEPIWDIDENNNIYKYDTINFAENYLEAYGLDNAISYDSNFRKLEQFKKDKYNRVGFRLSADKTQYEEIMDMYIRNYYNNFTDIKNIKNIDLKILMNKFPSEENNVLTKELSLNSFWLWIKVKFSLFKNTNDEE